MKSYCIIIFLLIICSESKAYTSEYAGCGPRSLEIIAKKKGIKTTIDEIYILSGFSQTDGTTLLGLKYAAERLGLPTVIVKLNKNQLVFQDFPIIAYVDSSHFIVIHGCKWFGYQIRIQDSEGAEQTIPVKQFTKRWTGEALLFSEKLKKQVEKNKVSEQEKRYTGPHIYIDETVQFFGTVEEGEKISRNFELVNTGSDTLNIYARSSCSCTSAMLSGRNIPPGKTGEIKVEFNTTGRSGPQKESVDVRTNDPQNPLIKLTIATTVQTGIKITPNRLWVDDIGQGKVVTREVKVISNGSGLLEIKKIDLPKCVTARIMEAVNDSLIGRYIPIQITYTAGTILGDFNETAIVTTTSEKDLDVYIQGRVVGEYIAFPPVAFFGQVKSSTSATREIRLAPTGKKQTIISKVISKSPFVSAKVKNTTADGSPLLQVSLAPLRGATTLNDTLRVFVAGSDQPTLEIPVFAQAAD